METKAVRITRLNSLLESYYHALAELSNGVKSYTIGSRQLTRADLNDIRDMIEWLESELTSLETGVGKRVLVSPRRKY